MLGPQQPNTTTTNLSVASPVDYWSQVGLAAQDSSPGLKMNNTKLVCCCCCVPVSPKNHPKKKKINNDQKTLRETIELYRSAYNIQFYLSCLYPAFMYVRPLTWFLLSLLFGVLSFRSPDGRTAVTRFVAGCAGRLTNDECTTFPA